MPDDGLSFLLFPVERPEFFDAVVLDERGSRARDPGQAGRSPSSHWIWGAFKMPGRVLRDLRRCGSIATGRTSISARWSTPISAQGGAAVGVRAAASYVDVGTLHGYRAAISPADAAKRDGAERDRVALGWPAVAERRGVATILPIPSDR